MNSYMKILHDDEIDNILSFVNDYNSFKYCVKYKSSKKLPKGIISYTDDNGNTLLHLAAQESVDTDIAKLLINNGSSTTLENNSGRTPLVCACVEDDNDMIEFLLNYENDINKKFGSDGETILNIAAGRDNLYLAELLLNNNANIEIKDDDKTSANNLLLKLKNLKLDDTIIFHN